MTPGKQPLSQEAIPKSFSRVIDASKIREEWIAKKRKLEEPAHAEKRRKLIVDEDQRAHNLDKRAEKLTTSHLKIKPGESMQHFNRYVRHEYQLLSNVLKDGCRRVEDDMRPIVKAAMRSSNAVVRDATKAEIEAKAEKKRHKILDAKATPDDDKTGPRSTRKPISQAPPPAADQPIRPQKDFVKHSSSAPRRLNDIAQAPPEFKKLPRGAAAALHGGPGSWKREGVLSMAQKSMMEEEREKVIMRYRELKAQRRDGGRERTDRVDSEGG